MINFQLGHLKYIASEHPEDLPGLIDGKLKENIMETTVQLLFQHENQAKDTQTGMKRTNIENLDLAPSSSNLLDTNDMDLIPEIVGLYEDSERVIDAIIWMKYKKPVPLKEDSMIIERPSYEKVRDDGNKKKKEKDENPTMVLEDHKTETDDKSKANYRENDINNQKPNYFVNNYPDYSQPPFINNNTNVPHHDIRRSGPMNMNNPDKNKWYNNMPYHGNYGGDRGNMGNYDNYQQMNYGQNMMNYGVNKGGFNNGSGPYPYPNPNIPPPIMQSNYNPPPNYTTPPPNYNQGFYSNQYGAYGNAPYGSVNESGSEPIGDSKYSSGNNHPSSGKMYRDQHKGPDSGKQKHFDKR